MKTVIEWIKPDDQRPPFCKPFLALLASNVSRDWGKTFEVRYQLSEVVMQRTSPNDDEPRSEYADFVSGESECPFSEYQFDLRRDEMERDEWLSDDIAWWAPMPDFRA